MGNVFHAKIKVKEKREHKFKSKIKALLANILDFIVVAFIYDKETYNKLMDKVDKLRRKIDE